MGPEATGSQLLAISCGLPPFAISSLQNQSINSSETLYFPPKLKSIKVIVCRAVNARMQTTIRVYAELQMRVCCTAYNHLTEYKITKIFILVQAFTHQKYLIVEGF